MCTFPIKGSLGAAEPRHYTVRMKINADDVKSRWQIRKQYQRAAASHDKSYIAYLQGLLKLHDITFSSDGATSVEVAECVEYRNYIPNLINVDSYEDVVETVITPLPIHD